MGLGLGAAVKLASGDAAAVWTLHRRARGGLRRKYRAARTRLGPLGTGGCAGAVGLACFPDTDPAFPPELTALICKLAGTEGILGNRHASGTVVLDEEGAGASAVPAGRSAIPLPTACCRSPRMKRRFGLERLLKLCNDLAPTLHAMKVGRVIARPFLGEVGDFKRTANRKDFAIAPPSPTMCDYVHDAGRTVHAVGKIGDIFSMRGIDDLRKGRDAALMEHINDLVDEAADGAFVFANLVEFDSEYGHRRDAAGYARPSGMVRWGTGGAFAEAETR